MSYFESLLSMTTETQPDHSPNLNKTIPKATECDQSSQADLQSMFEAYSPPPECNIPYPYCNTVYISDGIYIKRTKQNGNYIYTMTDDLEM